MSRRGLALREHILYAAKNVFLQVGFERASMDVIAETAQTSKRTLYAHFESKEKLYLAIIDLVRGVYLSKLKAPDNYSQDPNEAVVMFCGRFLEGMLFTWTIRMCRMTASEAERFPEASARYFDVLFTATHERLSNYLSEKLELNQTESSKAAHEILSSVIYPRFLRTLFGIDPAIQQLDDDHLAPDFDLKPIQQAVHQVLGKLLQSSAQAGTSPRTG